MSSLKEAKLQSLLLEIWEYYIPIHLYYAMDQGNQQYLKNQRKHTFFLRSSSFHTSGVTDRFLNNGVTTESIVHGVTKQMITTENVPSLCLSSKLKLMSSPREAELQSPFPGNDTNLLALQETLLGCSSKMPGKFSIFLMMGNMDQFG